jgi:hypothetical protein
VKKRADFFYNWISVTFVFCTMSNAYNTSTDIVQYAEAQKFFCAEN